MPARRAVLTAEEKRAARSVLHATWAEPQLTQAAITEAAAPWGIHPRDAYTTLLHLDTLACLAGEEHLVFRGGTCVQSFLPPGLQRYSVDLDLNSRHAHPSTGRAAMDALNARLRDEGRVVDVRGVPFGAIAFDTHDAPSGAVNFTRVMPTPFDELETVGEVTLQARRQRVQVNVKHHALPALAPLRREVSFFTQPALAPRSPVIVETASLADLYADKVLAITRDAGGFGRERIKDFYDLFALDRTRVAWKRVVEKLDIIAPQAGTTRAAILAGARERAESVRGEWARARGFVPAACKDGKRLLADWELEITRLQGRLARL